MLMMGKSVSVFSPRIKPRSRPEVFVVIPLIVVMLVDSSTTTFASDVTTFLITDKGFNYALPDLIFAQPSGNVTLPLNKTQEWISQKDNVKILFAYQPERPIIDTFTKLEFSVINLTNNGNLRDFDARVVVTNGQRLFKFENITVRDGDYSVEYIFPDDGNNNNN
jgi:hypothetical protein